MHLRGLLAVAVFFAWVCYLVQKRVRVFSSKNSIENECNRSGVCQLDVRVSSKSALSSDRCALIED